MDISNLLPNLLALHPRTEHFALAVENDQVSVCTSPEGTLLVLDPKTPRNEQGAEITRMSADVHTNLHKPMPKMLTLPGSRSHI